MGGSKNCPETPRQKMIGMMYLVLTAMLALNVSNEVLNGFTITDSSLHSTILSANMRTESLYEDFNALMGQNPTKTEPWLNKALEVKKHSDELYKTLQEFKVAIVKIADGKNADPEALKIENRENLDAAAQYAQLDDVTGKGRGRKLRAQIDAYRLLVDSLNPGKQDAYNEIFNTRKMTSLHSGQTVDWEVGMFDFMPVVAVTTLLTKYQSDVRAAESDVVSYLKSQTDASDFRVNKIQAYAFPTSSSYVIKGGKYSAQIVLSAVDSTLPAQYIVNGNNVPGGKYDVICNNVGTQKFSGQIQINRNGSSISYPFSQEYTVGMPQATVSNSDLNVVYRGIDNKFDIAVPGVAASQVVVTVEGGTATKTGDGKYNVRASRDGEIVIVVSATIEGKPTPMGRSPFRVKYLPDPKSFLQYTDAGGVVRQIQDASISKKLLRTGSIIASYGQDELVKANFEIISFNMVTDATGSASSSGSSLSSKQLSDIDKLEGGDNIMFKNIKAKGPDGKVRELPAVIVKL